MTDPQGLQSLDVISIEATIPGNTPPEASPVASPNTGLAPLVVNFAANAFDADGDNLTYAWRFGDPASADNSSSLANPSHVYAEAGTYVGWLSVRDGQDQFNTS